MIKTHRLVLAILVLIFCTGFDQITKEFAREKLAASPPILLLNGTILIQYSENTGAMLGLGASLPDNVRFAFFVILNGLISLTTLIYVLKGSTLHSMQIIGLLLVASGGLGNLLDRLLNKGAAIDFLNLGIGSIRTGIFNVADIWIVAGVSIFVLFSLREPTKTVTA